MRDNNRPTLNPSPPRKAQSGPAPVKTMTWDKDHSCLLCQRFSTCLHRQKAWNFVCSDFHPGLSLEQLESEIYATINASVVKATTDRTPEYRPAPSGDDAGEDFVARMIDSILANPGQQVDIKIDDGDFPCAPNFYEWITGPKYLNLRIFAKQVQMGIMALGEYCPHCSDTELIQDMPTRFFEDIGSHDRFRERVALLEHGVCPKCKRRKSQLLKDGELIEYKEIAAQCGQRSGKSKFLGMMGTYTTHRFVKLKSPNLYFGLLPNEQLVGTIVGLTFDTCKANAWNPMLSLFNTGPWFIGYHKMLRHYENKYGEAIVDLKDELIRYRHRNMLLIPSGPNKLTLRGATRFFGAHDEAALSSTTKADAVKMNASEVYTSLQSSLGTLVNALTTLRANGDDSAPVPMMLSTSSPLFVGDQMTLLLEAAKASKYIYGIHLATWEMNPDMPRDCEFLVNKFSQNAAAAQRDFGADPPDSASAFFDDSGAVTQMVQKNASNAVSLTPRLFAAPTGKEYMSASVAFNIIPDQNERLLTLDAGLSDNSFGFSVSRKSVTGAGIMDRDVIIEAVGEIIPSLNTPVSFTNVLTDVLKPIIREMGVSVVVADRWQSVLLLQDLESTMGVEIETMSLKYGDFNNYKKDLGEGKIKMPRCEVSPDGVMAMRRDYPSEFVGKPVAHVLFQHRTVRGIVGKPLQKGIGYTDDVFWTVALAHKVHTLEKYRERFIGRAGREKAKAGLAALGKAGGSSSNSFSARGSGSSSGGSDSKFAARR